METFSCNTNRWDIIRLTMVENIIMSLSLILDKNKKVKYQYKRWKSIILNFLVESCVNLLYVGWTHILLLLCFSNFNVPLISSCISIKYVYLKQIGLYCKWYQFFLWWKSILVTSQTNYGVWITILSIKIYIITIDHNNNFWLSEKI